MCGRAFSSSTILIRHSKPSSIALYTILVPFINCSSSSRHGIGLPGLDLRLRSKEMVSVKARYACGMNSNVRAVRLVCGPSSREVGDVVRLGPAAWYLGQRVLGRRLVDGVGEPCVPERLTLCAIHRTNCQCVCPMPLSISRGGGCLRRTGHSPGSYNPPIVSALPKKFQLLSWLYYRGIEGAVRGSSSVQFS